MRTVSELYKTLRAQTGSQYEIQVVRGPISYGMREIKSLKVYQSLLKSEVGPDIGGTVSSHCRLVVAETSSNWPRMASFQIRLRLVSEDGTQTSEWLSFGTYWTDTREETKNGDLSRRNTGPT